MKHVVVILVIFLTIYSTCLEVSLFQDSNCEASLDVTVDTTCTIYSLPLNYYNSVTEASYNFTSSIVYTAENSTSYWMNYVNEDCTGETVGYYLGDVFLDFCDNICCGVYYKFLDIQADKDYVVFSIDIQI